MISEAIVFAGLSAVTKNIMVIVFGSCPAPGITDQCRQLNARAAAGRLRFELAPD
jgi:hypothetical protein